MNDLDDKNLGNVFKEFFECIEYICSPLLRLIIYICIIMILLFGSFYFMSCAKWDELDGKLYCENCGYRLDGVK